MSIQQVAAVLDRSKSRGGARLVLISIANHDGDGGSWPTIDTICREAGLSERSVHEALRRLQDDGELRVHVNAGGTKDWDNRRRPNRYELVLPGVEDSATPSTHGVEVLDAHGVEDSSNQTVHEPSTLITRDQIAEWFSEWYAEYPRKRDVRGAEKAYRSALKAMRDGRGETLTPEQARDKLLVRVKRYAKLCAGRDQQYVKYPATWLNRGAYDDEDLLPGAWKNGEPRATPVSFDVPEVRYV